MKPVTQSRILEALDNLFDHTHYCFSNYYLSPTMMRINGYDTLRNKPELLDDELYIESHMMIGKGEDFDSSNADILWFCAANHLPSS